MPSPTPSSTVSRAAIPQPHIAAMSKLAGGTYIEHASNGLFVGDRCTSETMFGYCARRRRLRARSVGLLLHGRGLDQRAARGTGLPLPFKVVGRRARVNPIIKRPQLRYPAAELCRGHFQIFAQSAETGKVIVTSRLALLRMDDGVLRHPAHQDLETRSSRPVPTPSRFEGLAGPDQRGGGRRPSPNRPKGSGKREPTGEPRRWSAPGGRPKRHTQPSGPVCRDVGDSASAASVRSHWNLRKLVRERPSFSR
jgi:hypothetical protein